MNYISIMACFQRQILELEVDWIYPSLSDICLTFSLRGLGRMKISADSDPIWFFRMPASPKLKEIRLTLYPCISLNYTLDKTGICKLTDNLMH